MLYLFAVLPSRSPGGLPYAVGVSVASMLAFNFFFLEPVHTLTLSDSRNWFALLVFVVTSVVVSELATRSRRRAREAALLAEIATTLLEHGTVASELEEISAEAARALNAERAEIVLGDGRRAEGSSSRPRVGASGRSRSRAATPVRAAACLPALASLLGVAARPRAPWPPRRSTPRRCAAPTRSRPRVLRVGQPRPSHAADGDLDLGRRARPGRPRDRRRRIGRSCSRRSWRPPTASTGSSANLLDLSRLQAGAAEPARQLVALDELVAGALDELGAGGAAVEVSLPDDPAPVLVDAHQVQRALVNLVENALKYSPPCEPVRVQVTRAGARLRSA